MINLSPEISQRKYTKEMDDIIMRKKVLLSDEQISRKLNIPVKTIKSRRAFLKITPPERVERQYIKNENIKCICKKVLNIRYEDYKDKVYLWLIKDKNNFYQITIKHVFIEKNKNVDKDLLYKQACYNARFFNANYIDFVNRYLSNKDPNIKIRSGKIRTLTVMINLNIYNNLDSIIDMMKAYEYTR